MTFLKTPIARFLVAALTFSSVSSYAIVKFGWLDKKLTPTLVAAIPVQRAHFDERYKDEPIQKNDPTNSKNFYLKFEGSPAGEALEELKKSFTIYPRQNNMFVLEEFDRIQKDLKKRGYEASKNEYWAPPKDLVIFYEQDIGPEFKKYSDTPEYYLHSMRFKYSLAYQRIGKTLMGGDVYPKAILSGLVYFACLKPFDDCAVANATFDEAGYSWVSVPGPRGGNSSAGGGR